jgi:uncharacterized protein
MTESKKKKNEEELNINDIYTPLSVAKEEIWRRWNDKELTKKLNKFFKNDKSSFVKGSPKAFLVRNVTSPNKEFFRFLDIASGLELEENFLEFTKDKFTANNDLKYHLGKCFFFSGLGKNGGNKLSTMRIINFNTAEGKSFDKIDTIFGNNLVDFHHFLIEECLPNFKSKIIDISEWLSKKGSISSSFYSNYLAFFIRNGVLFENFLMDGTEAELTKNVVIPAIKKLENMFGVRPLIVPLLPLEDASDPYWCYYPADLEKKVKNFKEPNDSGNTFLFNGLKMKICDTKKYGIGVYAEQDIEKGRMIKIFDGKIVSREECLKMIEEEKTNMDDPFQIETDSFIILDYLSHAFNHSCSPNAGMKNDRDLFALKNIKKGEEITYDYSTTVGPHEDWEMKCKCGSNKCRKKIGNITSLSKNTLQYYKKNGALQRYIKLKINK